MRYVVMAQYDIKRNPMWKQFVCEFRFRWDAVKLQQEIEYSWGKVAYVLG